MTTNNALTLRDNTLQYMYQPALVQKGVTDLLATVTAGLADGSYDITDASNPFVFGLESGSVLTSAAMEKFQACMRQQYSSMAQTYEDLYRHMSDWDYEGRFSKPSHTKIGFAFSYVEVLSRMVTDPTTGLKKIVIPRNSLVTVADTVFSLQYPVEIRQMLHGGLQVVYDASQVSPLQALPTNVIDWSMRGSAASDGQVIDMIYFELDLLQLNATSYSKPVTKSSPWSFSANVTDQYYYTRVWAQSADGSTWTEIKTTMAPDVYDPITPTAKVTVLDKKVTVSLPQIYTTQGMVSGKIRVDIYETKGSLSMDLGAYPTSSFVATWQAFDSADITQYTAPMNRLQTFVMMGNSITTGGADELPFITLRQRVINNAVGPINLPITPVQMEAKLNNAGYSVVKNVDNITNRTYLATRAMPTPTNAKLITSAAASIETFTTSMTALSLLDTVVDNGKSLTIMPNTLYKNVSGVVKVAPSSEIDALLRLPPTNRALAVNSSEYFYTPFHYVLDASGGEFAMRAYYLDAPVAVTTVFKDTNDTTGLQVSTKSYSLVRTATGYSLNVVVASGDVYKQLPDNQCYVQLAYIPAGETTYAYLNGVLAGLDPTTGERVFTFDLSSTLNINASDNIEFTQFKMSTTDPRIVAAALETTFEILYSTTAVLPATWKRSAMDDLLGFVLLPNTAHAIQREQITLQFGVALKQLWSRARSVLGDIPYKTYATDVPKYYTEDVYQTNPDGSTITVATDGTVSYNIIHHVGDPVLDVNGNPVMDHYAGDVVTDASGLPVVGGTRDLLRQLEVMMIEGAYYFATDSVATGYRAEIITNILAWLENDLAPLSDILLEETSLYFYPKSTMGDITVINQSGLKVSISAGQVLQVVNYVSPQVFNNEDLKSQLALATIQTLATGVDQTTVAQSDLISALKTAYGDDVVDIEISGLGGSNMPVFTVLDSSTRCGLRKILVAQGDDSLIVSEAVTVLFVPYDTSAAK